MKVISAAAAFAVLVFAVSTWAFAGPVEDAAAQAWTAFAANDFDRAITILDKAVSDNPFEEAGLKDMLGKAFSARGWSRLGTGNYEGALSDFKQANLDEKEKRPLTYLGLGYTFYRLKNSDDALYYLQEAEYLDPKDGRVHMLLGQINYERGKLDEAAKELQLAVDSGQDIPGLKDYLAKVKKEQGVEESFTKRETYYFNIKYEGEEKRELGDYALKTMSAAYADVGGDLGYYPKEPVNVILYTRQQFNDVTDAPSWSGGVFDGNIRVPVGGANIDRDALAAVLYHEYTHAVIHMVAGGRLPTWLDEAAKELQLAVDSGQDIPGLKDYLAKVKKEQGVEESFTKRETYYFNIKYEGEEKRELGDYALKTMSAAYADVGGDLGYYPKEPVNVILYTRQQFNDVTDAPSWSGGVFDGNIRVPVGGANIDKDALAAVLYHEYTHAVIHMVAGGRLPTWLDEGIAQYEERWVRQPKSEPPGPDLRSLSSLSGSFMGIGDAQAARQAYAESLSAVDFYVSRYGMYSLSKLVRLIGEGSKIDAAMDEAVGVSLGDFEGTWKASLGR